MAKIKVLDIDTVNQIAAGEVVERPASVIKELMENAIDAGATSITVEIKNGGITFMRVTDNGCGIGAEDIETAFLPHSTSKISSIEDLTKLYTMGFRGEALASIAAVSKVDVITKPKEELAGTTISLEGGKIIRKDEAGCPNGTTIVVRELFYNTPARMNFLKKDVTEAAHISDVVDKMVLGNPGISIRLISGGRDVVFSPGTGKLADAFAAVYGREIVAGCVPVEYSYEGIHISGFAGLPAISRANRSLQNFFVNGRWVKSKIITFGGEDAYKTMLMTGKYPVLLLNINLNSAKTDVNVHPTKMEIKFSDEKTVRDAVFWGVQNALFSVERARPAGQGTVKSTYKREEFTLQEPPAPEEAPALAFHEPAGPEETKNRPAAGNPREGGTPPAVKTAGPVAPASKTKKTSQADPGFFPREHQPSPQDYFTKDMLELMKKTDGHRETPPAGSADQKPLKEKRSAPAAHKEETEPAIAQAAAPHKVQQAQQEIGSGQKTEGYRIAGQVFGTYVLVEQSGKLLLIDQHAAHERLKYEELVQAKTVLSQVLMFPETIRLSAAEGDILLQNCEVFSQFGFEIEEFGNHEYIVRQAPSIIGVDQIQNTVLSLITLIGENKDPAQIYDKGLFMVACKSAIKANHNLSAPEMEALVKNVMENDRVRTCPHGRPVMISFDKRYIEKEFKRIV